MNAYFWPSHREKESDSSLTKKVAEKNGIKINLSKKKAGCPLCENYNKDKGTLTVVCYGCCRYHPDLFEPRKGKK